MIWLNRINLVSPEVMSLSCFNFSLLQTASLDMLNFTFLFLKNILIYLAPLGLSCGT